MGFSVKTASDDSIERYKARLVAQGFSQKYGLDYDETFSPVVRPESIRTVIALAVKKGLKLHQMDVTTAFLNGELEEEVYMKQPEGFVADGQEHLVCKLRKSIYGLKQPPRCWNSALNAQLKTMGFNQSASDPCIYTSLEEMFILAVYVDDIVLAGKTDERIEEVKNILAKRFRVKDIGELLGVTVAQDQTSGRVWIGQANYTENVLHNHEMENSRSITTPVDTSNKLLSAIEESEVMDQRLYQSAVGSLLYLSCGTRPDITIAVSNVARFCSKPTKQHWTAVKRIMRYLRGTQNYGILYTRDCVTDVEGYSDADWAGDVNDRKSTSGYVFTISGGAVSWKSKKQTSVALSTAETEYMALASTAQEAMWMRQLTADLKSAPSKATTIYEDNQSAIEMAKNPVSWKGKTYRDQVSFHS